MNRVIPETPLEETARLIQRDGYALMENALAAAQISDLSEAYDRQLDLHSPQLGATRLEVPRILERDPAFEILMDLPTVFPVARALIGADIELARAGNSIINSPALPPTSPGTMTFNG